MIYSQSIDGKSKKRNDFLKVFPNAKLFKDYTEKGDCEYEETDCRRI